ncbi:hypothetical protein BN1080_01664 [Planococcus massiliensis]|uniref:General stress protein n=1 Tax=Planococcus massiliensis TaxID=1499687 RepID=A0A098EK46_9BACL|nr:DUF948 domain-containing protein [Planococcus massiliensis]CEG22729.1 hypothetical protein BN1080_01664 [Planococcus massiliensis]
MDSTIWLYAALGIVVLGIIIAGIGVFLMIKGIKEPMKEIKGSANNLKDRMDNLKLETTSLQHHANEIKEDVQVKSEKITLFLDAAKGTKNSVVDLNSSVRAITKDITHQVDNDRHQQKQVEQWSNTAVTMLAMAQEKQLPKHKLEEHADPVYEFEN